jgi:GcrA cell cycle regulator
MTNISQPPSAGWTEARLASLVELWNARLSAAQIARTLGGGISRSAVVGKLFRMGLTRDAGERRAARADGARQSRRKQLAAQAAQRGPGPRPPSFPATPLPAMTACGAAPRLVGILELRPSSCRWPYAVEAETRFCGHGAQADSAYCPAHHRRAYEALLPPLTTEQIEALAASGRRAR